MKKIRYIVIIIVFLSLSLLFFGAFFLSGPILDHLETRFEKKWACQVEKRKADFSLLKGSLRFGQIHITALENAVSRWSLDAEEVFIQIDYPSLIKGTTLLNRLTLDKVFFRQEKREGSDIKSIVPEIAKREANSKQSTEKKSSRGPRNAILIRYFLMRDGCFEFYYHENSGKKRRLKLEHVSLSKREIFLDRRLDIFFQSLCDGLEGSGP
jgi:hypothetical protein